MKQKFWKSFLTVGSVAILLSVPLSVGADAYKVGGNETILLEKVQNRQEEEGEAVRKISISCSSRTKEVAVGNHVSVEAKISPVNAANQKLVFTSSDPAIASVDSSGVVTGKKYGRVMIRVASKKNPDVSAKIEISVRIPAPESVTVICSETGDASANLSWSKVKGAASYSVYRKVDDGEWRKVASGISGTTYYDSNTAGDADNVYSVVAVCKNKKYSSPKSESVSLHIPQTPYGVKISSITDKGIEYYWKKPADVEGYEVYRSYHKDKGYEKIATLDRRKIDTYLDAKFDSEKRAVYYKIRSYAIDSNGKKVFSKLSESRTAEYYDALTLDQSKAFLRTGATRTAQAFLGWGNADNLVWTSSDERIATVSKDGVITGKSAGECKITCYSKDADDSCTCSVIVDRQPLRALSAIIPDYIKNSEGQWVDLSASQDNDALIMMVGDMMCTGTQQADQGYHTGDYNFNESFVGVKEWISSADFSIGNLETTLSSTWPYMHEEAYIDNKPNCNAPSRYLDAVLSAGFDGVVMSNNHNCDAGEDGAIETIDQVDRYKLARTGLFRDSEDDRQMLVDVDGIRVGYLSYTSEETGFNLKDKDWDSSDVDTMLNYYSREKAERDIRELRKSGAEYVFVYMHWGVKNVSTLTDSQKAIAQELADVGTDYIVGSHCHLIQKFTTLTSSDGREVPCFFSLGDFQSSIDQIPGNRDSVILRVRLTRDEEGNVVLQDNQYISCYTKTKHKGMYYYTLPVLSSLNDGTEIDDAKEIHRRITDAVGNEITEYTGT